MSSEIGDVLNAIERYMSEYERGLVKCDILDKETKRISIIRR